MVFLISYRRRVDASKLRIKLRKTFFAEHKENPSSEEIETLVSRISQGDFSKESIQLQKCVGFDANELSRAGVTVHRLDSAVERQDRREP